jgi:hypothetical protein
VDATLTFPGQVVEAGLQLVRLDLPFDAIRVRPREAPRWWPSGWPVAASGAAGPAPVPEAMQSPASTPPSHVPVGGDGLKLRGP